MTKTSQHPIKELSNRFTDHLGPVVIRLYLKQCVTNPVMKRFTCTIKFHFDQDMKVEKTYNKDDIR